jgi:hypothetical protein
LNLPLLLLLLGVTLFGRVPGASSTDVSKGVVGRPGDWIPPLLLRLVSSNPTPFVLLLPLLSSRTSPSSSPASPSSKSAPAAAAACRNAARSFSARFS